MAHSFFLPARQQALATQEMAGMGQEAFRGEEVQVLDLIFQVSLTSEEWAELLKVLKAKGARAWKLVEAGA